MTHRECKKTCARHTISKYLAAQSSRRKAHFVRFKIPMSAQNRSRIGVGLSCSESVKTVFKIGMQGASFPACYGNGSKEKLRPVCKNPKVRLKRLECRHAVAVRQAPQTLTAFVFARWGITMPLASGRQLVHVWQSFHGYEHQDAYLSSVTLFNLAGSFTSGFG